jgi:amidase
MTHDEYVSLDALGLAELVRRREVSATELLELALAHHERTHPRINAVVRLMEDYARRAAAHPEAGPFSGVPFLLKDLLGLVAGYPTSMGSRLLRDVAEDHDSELVRRYRAAGLVILGKTNTPEWGLVPFTEPEVWGPTRNPWDLERTPGGSSGGSGAAVAARVVPIASGGDGGGSIRIPASCCGLFGMKPTRGRTPTGPDHGQLWRGAVVEHVLTRSVRDSAAALDAIHGPDPGAPYEIAPPSGPYLADAAVDPGHLRIAFTTHPFLGSSVHDECVRAVHEAATLLEALGHEVEEAAPDVDGSAFSRAFLMMVAAELGADLEEVEARIGRRARPTELEAPTRALGLLANAFSAREYASALRMLERAGRRIGPFFLDYDVLVTPTLAAPPPPIGSMDRTPTEKMLLRALGAAGSGRLVRLAGLLNRAAADAFELTPWTPVFNVTGQPAMSVPLARTEGGLPIGVHFVGRFGDESTLFRLAGQLERARPWADRRPALAEAD